MSSAQTWDPATYARNARFVSDLGSPVLEMLAPLPGERILDLGCGDGAPTQQLVERRPGFNNPVGDVDRLDWLVY